MTSYRFAWIAIPLLVLGLLSSASVAPHAAPQAALGQPPVVVRLARQPAEQGFVGEDRCRACHKAEVAQFHKTPHLQVVSTVTGQRMDCESCHGAGKPHSDAEEAAKGEEPATSVANKLIF